MINNIRDKFGIIDGKDISLGQFESLMNALNKQEIGTNETFELLQNIPNIIEIQKAYLDNIQNTVNAVKEVQKTTLDRFSIDAINDTIKTLNKLLESNMSESFKEKILENILQLSEKVSLFNEMLERVNKENNSFWGKVFSTIAVVAVTSISLFAYKNKNA